MKNSKSKAWDEVGGLFWTKGRVSARPTEKEINFFLEDYGRGDKCLILGASTFYLIESAVKKEMAVTVVDFSKRMIDDLLKNLNLNYDTKLLDVINPSFPDKLEENLYNLIVCDRLINRFEKDEVPIFFENVKTLLKNGGSFRASIKLGFYPMDEKILRLANEQGILNEVYDQQSCTINFAASKKILYEAIEPHGDIDKEILFKWYVGRGKESRFSKESLEQIIRSSCSFQNMDIKWMELSPRTNTVMIKVN